MMAIVRITIVDTTLASLHSVPQGRPLHRNSRQSMVGQTLWYLNNKSICNHISTILPPVAIDFDLNVKGPGLVKNRAGQSENCS